MGSEGAVRLRMATTYYEGPLVQGLEHSCAHGLWASGDELRGPAASDLLWAPIGWEGAGGKRWEDPAQITKRPPCSCRP